MSLEKQIEDDFDTMMQYMSDNKLYPSMVKSLEMVKSTHPRYDYWFKIWEEGQHREKYNETRTI